MSLSIQSRAPLDLSKSCRGFELPLTQFSSTYSALQEGKQDDKGLLPAAICTEICDKY